ncbi:MAG: metal-dependent hydrolase [Elusimicrobia bacterium]|nr:metal-dependent hydrolase [Elusimicrobiota bacterium]
MDPVTHTLLGAAIGEAFYRPRLGRRAVAVSAWAANLPDIDALVMLTGDPGAVVLRRSFGHSLFLLPLWIAGLTWVFKRKYGDMDARDLAEIIALGCAGHLLFDLINSFGVQLFWPLSSARPELATIFIIDLTLAGFLAAPHLLRLKEAWRPKLPAACRTALAAATFYLAMAFSARQYALLLLARETGGRGFQYAFPEPLGAHRWRGVVREADAWRVYLVDVGRGVVEPRMTVPDHGRSPQARAARETPFGRRLEAFFKAPAWTVSEKPGGGWTAEVRDLRFASLVLPRAAPFTYEFDVAAGGGLSAKPRGVKIW